MFLWDLGLGRRVLQLRTQVLTSLGAVRIKAPVVTDVRRDGYGYGESTLRSLGLCFVEVGYGMCLQVLRSRKLEPPVRNPDIHHSGGSQDQGSPVTRFLKPDVSYVQSSFIFYMSKSLPEAVLDDTDL